MNWSPYFFIYLSIYLFLVICTYFFNCSLVYSNFLLVFYKRKYHKEIKKIKKEKKLKKSFKKKYKSQNV